MFHRFKEWVKELWQSRFLKILGGAIALVILVLALVWIILQGYSPSANWTGFADYTKPNSDYVRGKTLWDWMQLFLIPLFLSFGVFFLNRSERESEREIAADRQRETALQSYLDKMADLLLKEKLRTSQDEEARDVARIRTLTVLRGLDPSRRRIVILFLHEAKLINAEEPIINLRTASLKGTYLENAFLQGVNLKGAYLGEADLENAKLQGANLHLVHLGFANLKDANLEGANLEHAFLHGASLQGANLQGANLQDARLQGAILKGADLSGVNFTQADLTGAEVSDEQLATAKSLAGAIMPDGSRHD